MPPPAISCGQVAVMVPEVVPGTEPMVVGLAKLPDASEISAVNTFHGYHVPVAVKLMENELPGQTLLNEMV